MSGPEDMLPLGGHLSIQPGVTPDAEAIRPPRGRRRELSVEDLLAGIRRGDRALLGRAFSLVESALPAHRAQIDALVEAIMPSTGYSVRLGISGPPGVGKSTFIEALGMALVEQGRRVAVLAVDPSSGVTGGSILGDKTRMERLSRHERAFVRPSACGGYSGGIARGTREAILICEAAGYDPVLVETVGVGQSEAEVASMVDFFLLLLPTGAGDELQGIKRGAMELADGLAITKGDGGREAAVEAARVQFQATVRLFQNSLPGWTPRVVATSAVTGRGIEDVWRMVCDHHALLVESGRLAERRGEQRVAWMRRLLRDGVWARFLARPDVAAELARFEEGIRGGTLSPSKAAESILAMSEQPKAGVSP